MFVHSISNLFFVWFCFTERAAVNVARLTAVRKKRPAPAMYIPAAIIYGFAVVSSLCCGLAEPVKGTVAGDSVSVLSSASTTVVAEHYWEVASCATHSSAPGKLPPACRLSGFAVIEDVQVI